MVVVPGSSGLGDGVLEHGGTLSGLLMAQLEKVNGRQVLDPTESALSYLHLLRISASGLLSFSCPLTCHILLSQSRLHCGASHLSHCILQDRRVS